MPYSVRHEPDTGKSPPYPQPPSGSRLRLEDTALDR
jgi:hypothetical protein